MQLTLEIPDQFALDASPLEVGQRIKLYAALTMYQSGRLSAGAACEFADIDRFTFMAECKKHQISVITYEDNELSDELASLQGSFKHSENRYSYGLCK